MTACNVKRCANPATTTDRLGDPCCEQHRDWQSCLDCGEMASHRDRDGVTWCAVHAPEGSWPLPVEQIARKRR